MRRLNLYLKFKMKTLRNFNPFKGCLEMTEIGRLVERHVS